MALVLPLVLLCSIAWSLDPRVDGAGRGQPGCSLPPWAAKQDFPCGASIATQVCCDKEPTCGNSHEHCIVGKSMVQVHSSPGKDEPCVLHVSDTPRQGTRTHATSALAQSLQPHTHVPHNRYYRRKSTTQCTRLLHAPVSTPPMTLQVLHVARHLLWYTLVRPARLGDWAGVELNAQVLLLSAALLLLAASPRRGQLWALWRR